MATKIRAALCDYCGRSMSETMDVCPRCTDDFVRRLEKLEHQLKTIKETIDEKCKTV